MHRFLGILVATWAASAIAAEERFTVDSSHTLPVFEVDHLGFSTQRGRFNRTAGHIRLDRAQQTGSVDITIDADSIDMGSEKWNAHMKSGDFFNVARFPTITYHSDRLLFEHGKPIAAEGVLTLLGVSKPVRVTLLRFGCGENPIVKKPVCAADIEAELNRSEFGMTTYLPAVGDAVRVRVPVEAFRD